MVLISRSESKDQATVVPCSPDSSSELRKSHRSSSAVGVGFQDGQWVKEGCLGQGDGVGQNGSFANPPNLSKVFPHLPPP